MNDLRLILGFLLLGAGTYTAFLLSQDKKPVLKNAIDNKKESFINSGLVKFEKSLNMWTTPPKGQKYEKAFQSVTAKYALPDGLLSRVAYQESRYNPNAKSKVGAIGLMQFMPATAKQYGIDPLNTELFVKAG